MYKIVETDEAAQGQNGAELTPVSTLEDSDGGVRIQITRSGSNLVVNLRGSDGTYSPIQNIPPHVHSALKDLDVYQPETVEEEAPATEEVAETPEGPVAEEETPAEAPVKGSEPEAGESEAPVEGEAPAADPA